MVKAFFFFLSGNRFSADPVYLTPSIIKSIIITHSLVKENLELKTEVTEGEYVNKQAFREDM